MDKLFKLFAILFSVIFFGCDKTFVSYDQENKNFVINKGKPSTETIVIEEGDTCEVVDDLFVVCGK